MTIITPEAKALLDKAMCAIRASSDATAAELDASTELLARGYENADPELVSICVGFFHKQITQDKYGR